MSYKLDKVVPWGRPLEEYAVMFLLSDNDLTKSILGCGDGPASFNAQLTERGGSVRSVDPIYKYSAEAIRKRIEETFSVVQTQTRKNRHEFLWDRFRSVDHLGQVRMKAMEAFLADYPTGLRQGRYVTGALPQLPFADGQFDLALCSHFLFLYSEQFSEEFHMMSIRELCRVADDARIFPLLELGSRKSRHLKNVSGRLIEEGYDVSIVTVPYEFQRGGNQMMNVRAAALHTKKARPV